MQDIRQPLLSSKKGFLPWLLIAWAGWWTLVCWPLAGHWSTDAQYTYGWLVMPLAAWLAWKRWPDRPIPTAVPSWAGPLIVLCAVAMLPGWLIAKPNPGWRLIPWLLAFSAVGGSLGILAKLGGRSWAAHFAFPVLFTLTAIPWPGFVEAPLVQGLMRFVAACTVTLLNIAGYPAMQRGNLVEVAAGVLGVDEACSGVRSLQAAFMASLFLGELHRLKIGARVGLVLAGFGAAVVTNIGRTSWLSFSAARDGLGAVSGWHDPAGYTVLTVCLVVLALLAEWMRSRFAAERLPGSASPAHAVPAPWGWLLAGWLVAVVLGTEAWYFRPIQGPTENWTLTMPPGASAEKLPKETLDLLGCDRTQSVTWHDAAGARWQLYFLEWFPRRSRTAVLAQVHRPEVCMPSAGLTEVGDRRTVSVSAAGFDLKFQSLHFRNPAGLDAFVFYCPWEIVPGTRGRSAEFSDATRTASLRRVWRREGVTGQQVAELVVTGLPSREAAEAALAQQIVRMAQPTVPK